MPKHPVPKKKTTKRVTKQRYGSHQGKALKRLSASVVLVDCKDCDAKHLAHHVCHDCGMYRGRQVIDKASLEEKVTKIKA